jgi:Flp pilus assembly pilin Flp
MEHAYPPSQRVASNVKAVYLASPSNSFRKGGEIMELFKRLIIEEEGQGLVEYALIVLLVVFVFWLAIKDTNIGNQLSAAWANIGSCLASPTTCSS